MKRRGEQTAQTRVLCIFVLGVLLQVSAASGEANAADSGAARDELPAAAGSTALEYEMEEIEGTFHRFSHRAMATEFTISVYTPDVDRPREDFDRVVREAFDVIDDIEARLSRYRPDSQVSYINNRAAQEPVQVSADILDLFDVVQDVHRQSKGAFDPTVGPLLKVWGFYRQTGTLPTQEALDDALSLVGLDKVVIDRENRTVSFLIKGMMLDFGGVAKGFALDHAAHVLRRHGIDTAALDAGTSTVVVLGMPPGRAGWTVRLRHPYNRERYIATVVLSDVSFSSSGLGERFVEIEGKRYGHIFDPRSGLPVDGKAAAAAIAPTGALSDALSTAFFVMGIEEVKAYCGSHPEVRSIIIPASESGDPEPVWINFPKREERR